jgi:ABC-2 type transport system ATP-binding protein
MSERKGAVTNGEGRVIRLAVDIRSAGYEAGKAVIRDVRFDVGAGELVGLIGPNGAGKSTTIRAVLGLLPRTVGDIRFGEGPGLRPARPVDAGESDGAGEAGTPGNAGGVAAANEPRLEGQAGHAADGGRAGEAERADERPTESSDEGRTESVDPDGDAGDADPAEEAGPEPDGHTGPSGRTGRYAYVPEQPVYYEYLTLWEHLRLAAAAHGLAEEAFAPRAERLLERFRLLEHRHEFPAKFSKGMQQKMMLAIGFMLEPDLYIVDEPFIGLDPHAVRDLLDLLGEERRRGAGILMSTHVLDAAERICDRFVLMNGGTVVARGRLDDVRRQAGLAGDAPLFDCFLELTKR